MVNSNLKVCHVKDGTEYGYDITEDSQRLWYFIQFDIFGDGRVLGIWNPDNKLRSYKSFKEALIYQAIAYEDPICLTSTFKIVRSYGQFDIKNIEVINTENDTEYYN